MRRPPLSRFAPLPFVVQDFPYGNDWAHGFVRGKDDRVVLFNDENHGGSLVPIFALAHEHDPDPEMRPYKEPISAEQREKLIIGAAAGVMNIYKYFRIHHVTRQLCLPSRDAQDRSERTLPVRIRQEIQTLLWQDHGALEFPK
jgi:hypothetical protein